MVFSSFAREECTLCIFAMATPFRSWVLILMVAAATTTHKVQAKPIIETKKSVRIRNQLPDTLQLHCLSRDDDLKVQYLPPGKEYTFSFWMNIWGTTDYWCLFHYGNLWNGFDVWIGPGLWGMRTVPCHHCLWVVETAGFFRGEEFGKDPIFQHAWKVWRQR